MPASGAPERAESVGVPTAASYPVFASGTHPACGAQSRRYTCDRRSPRPSGSYNA
jgi:hypothetical protein